MKQFILILCCLLMLLSCHYNSEPNYEYDSLEGMEANTLFSDINHSKHLLFTRNEMGKIHFLFSVPSHNIDIPADISISYVKLIINGLDVTSFLNENYPYGDIPIDYIAGNILLVNFEVEGRYYGKKFRNMYHNTIQLAYPIQEFNTNNPQTIDQLCHGTWVMQNNNEFQFISSHSYEFVDGGDGTIQFFSSNIANTVRECNFTALTIIPNIEQPCYGFAYGVNSFNANKYGDLYVVSSTVEYYRKTIFIN